MKSGWNEYVAEISKQLSALSIRNGKGESLPADKGFDEWLKLTWEVKQNHKIVYLIGNGASAAMASHFGADLAKNGHLHTQVLTDPSMITAISNDIHYDQVYVFPLSMWAREGDMLVAISSSGGSPNILKAVEEAKKHKMIIVTVSGMKENNPLRSAGTLNFYVPAGTYGYVESTHSVILHHWMDLVESRQKNG